MFALTTQKLGERHYAAPEEAAGAIARLSEADLQRVARFARIRATGVRPWDWEDLVHEAIARILSGSRRWPQDIPLVVFLRETIRSLAQEERRRRGQASLARFDPTDETMQIPDDAPGPDRVIAARNVLGAILDRVEADPMMLQLVQGLESGETAVEMCSRTGMTAQQFDATRKRFRRSVDAWLKEDESLHGD